MHAYIPRHDYNDYGDTGEVFLFANIEQKIKEKKIYKDLFINYYQPQTANRFRMAVLRQYFTHVIITSPNFHGREKSMNLQHAIFAKKFQMD